MSPREMLFEICRLLGRRFDRRVQPDELTLRISMANRFPQFVLAYTSATGVDLYEGEPGGTPTQGIDNLLNLLEKEDDGQNGD